MNYLKNVLHQWQTPFSELAYYYPDFQVEIIEPDYLQVYAGKWTFVFSNNRCAAQINLPGQTVIYGPEHDLQILVSKHNLPTYTKTVETSPSDMINLLVTSDIPEEVKTVLRRHIEFTNMRNLNVLKHVFSKIH